MKLAIVSLWFGKHVKGGAEQQAWQVATRLKEKGIDVTILASCSKEFHSDWSYNHFKEKDYIEDGLLIKRFSLKKRNTKQFDSVNARLMSLKKKDLHPGISPLSESEELIYLKENIYSSSLDRYIKQNKNKYDFFLFIPYLFPNIINGVELVQEKAILQPCLHDESYAYLKCVRDMFFRAGHLFLNSRGEFKIMEKIYGPALYAKSSLVYEGIETDFADGKEEYGDFILYLGRRDIGKNIDFLIQAFDKFCLNCNSDLKLLIAGVGDLPVQPQSNNIIDLGLITESKKNELLKKCKALINPSQNESFSRVIFESWFLMKPVVINSKCEATYLALKDSGWAGFHFNNMQDLIAIFAKLDKIQNAELIEMGKKGRQYASEIADWDNVIDRYLVEFENIQKNLEKKIKVKNTHKSIHQLLPNLSYGDAISNQARIIRNLLLEKGYDSKIFVCYIDPRVADECEKFESKKLKKEDGLIYHHSIGFEYTENAVKHAGRKALIYHNITPKDFFENYRPAFAEILDKGRKDLSLLKNAFDWNFGVSQFNIRELKNCGFENLDLLPLIVSPEKWSYPLDQDVINCISDKKNIIFTGRIAPNKKQTDLVEMMRFLRRINHNSRLIIVGSGEEGDPYYMELLSLINKYNLQDNVIITGHVSEEALQTYYMYADLFVSMSEHEGFGVPLIEAMWFDIPVLAFYSSAVPETLSSAAVMFDNKKDMAEIASIADVLLTDSNVREKIIDAQRKRCANFTWQSVSQKYDTLIKDMIDV